MTLIKPDAHHIKDVLVSLAGQDFVKRTERRWWPEFVFHYTGIQNAVKILQDGCLYSRKCLEDARTPFLNGASSTVLAGTGIDVKDCVRLYFRPKTPTQYHVEGIRSQETLSASQFPDAHIPVPVFFLFDAAQVLTRSDCSFSDGNLASGRARVLSTAAELASLPWEKIYHTEPIGQDERDIVFHRNAEVIVPHSLDLARYASSTAGPRQNGRLYCTCFRQIYQSATGTRSWLRLAALSSSASTPLSRERTCLQIAPFSSSRRKPNPPVHIPCKSN